MGDQLIFFILISELPPDDSGNWKKNDARHWPNLSYEDLVDYLIHKKAYDGRQMKAFRAMYANNYVQNGWLGDVYHAVTPDKHFLKAKVSPSQPGVGRADYDAWVAIDSKSTVLTGHCSCPAGNGASCSHISAILYAIVLAWKHGLAGETCTDRKKAWGLGAAKVKMHGEILDMNFKHPKVSEIDQANEPKTSPVPRIEQFLDHEDLVQKVSGSCTSLLWNCKGTILNKILTAQERPLLQNQQQEHGNHEADYTSCVQTTQCSPCDKFFQAFVNIDNTKRYTIQEATTKQSGAVWIDGRKLRLTASRINSIPKTERGNGDKFVTNQIYPRFKGNDATRHGQKFETTARQWFQDETGLTVKESGLVIHPEESYVAASPDGIINDDTILEIKCPTKPLNQLLSTGKYDVQLDQEGKHVLQPKGRNGYYTQVQMTMYCTGRSKCKFVVWTEEESVIVDVCYDRDFVMEIMQRVRKFYFQTLLVRLTDEYRNKRLKLCNDYKTICSSNTRKDM